MPYLPYISDELLKEYVQEVLTKARAAEDEAEANLYQNVIDPFSAVFAASLHKLTLEQWVEREMARQIQKTLENALGSFHQNILGSMDGWENAGRGGSFDVQSQERKIIAELKNKHNTMNSSSAEAVYQKLANHLRYSNIPGFKAYVVFIIPKSSARFDKPWSPNQHTMAVRDDIRQVDGASFYDLATGHKGALKMLYEALPTVILDVLGHGQTKVDATKAFDDLFTRAYGNS